MVRKIPLYEVDSNFITHVLALQIEGTEFSYSVKLKSTFASRWNNSPVEYPIVYGISYEDVKRAQLSNLIDSIPSGYNTQINNARGYPFTDTVVINL
ncbi:MAG: hypothetical protein Salg2KO_03260 [Salibacteraceae bacterium]